MPIVAGGQYSPTFRNGYLLPVSREIDDRTSRLIAEKILDERKAYITAIAAAVEGQVSTFTPRVDEVARVRYYECPVVTLPGVDIRLGSPEVRFRLRASIAICKMDRPTKLWVRLTEYTKECADIKECLRTGFDISRKVADALIPAFEHTASPLETHVDRARSYRFQIATVSLDLPVLQDAYIRMREYRSEARRELERVLYDDPDAAPIFAELASALRITTEDKVQLDNRKKNTSFFVTEGEEHAGLVAAQFPDGIGAAAAIGFSLRPGLRPRDISEDVSRSILQSMAARVF